MTVNQVLMYALTPFGDPVFFGEFAPGEEIPDRYYTFNYFKRGDDFGDDTPGHEHYFVQVHLYCPRDYDSLERIRETCDSLFEAEFSWPEVTHGGTSEGQHIVFECEYVTEIGNRE